LVEILASWRSIYTFYVENRIYSKDQGYIYTTILIKGIMIIKRYIMCISLNTMKNLCDICHSNNMPILVYYRTIEMKGGF
jgi:hypothetical protein